MQVSVQVNDGFVKRFPLSLRTIHALRIGLERVALQYVRLSMFAGYVAEPPTVKGLARCPVSVVQGDSLNGLTTRKR